MSNKSSEEQLRPKIEERIIVTDTEGHGRRSQNEKKPRVLDRLKAKGQCKEGFRSPEERHRNSKVGSKVPSRTGSQSEHPDGIRMGCDGRPPSSSTF